MTTRAYPLCEGNSPEKEETSLSTDIVAQFHAESIRRLISNDAAVSERILDVLIVTTIISHPFG